jgi:hypothetical protein
VIEHHHSVTPRHGIFLCAERSPQGSGDAHGVEKVPSDQHADLYLGQRPRILRHSRRKFGVRGEFRQALVAPPKILEIWERDAKTAAAVPTSARTERIEFVGTIHR